MEGVVCWHIHRIFGIEDPFLPKSRSYKVLISGYLLNERKERFYQDVDNWGLSSWQIILPVPVDYLNWCKISSSTRTGPGY